MSAGRSGRVTRDLQVRLSEIYKEVLRAEQVQHAVLDAMPPATRDCARNLIGYVALRRNDLRVVQRWLHSLGISSLGHTESYVREGLDVVLARLGQVNSTERTPAMILQERALRRGRAHLRRRTDALLGKAPPGRDVRIMVTMPSEAATDPALVLRLLEAGMDCMRINCAHDGPAEWEAMIANLRAAQSRVARPCRVLMDLAGPKLRTGPIAAGTSVRRCRPRKDELGRTVSPAQLTLVPEGTPVPYRPGGDITLPVPAAPLGALRSGDQLAFTDARGKARDLAVVSAGSGLAVCEASRSAYIVPGTRITRTADGLTLEVSAFPGRPGGIPLAPGDALVLDNRPDWPGTPAVRGSQGEVVRPARLPFTLPDVFADVRAGQPVFFDDGKIAAVVQAADPQALTLRIVQTRPGGGVLRADKGVNMPESEIRLPALGERDLEHLDFAIAHADLVGLSFVRTPKDVEALFAALQARKGGHLGIILKIETRQGVQNLPDLLLTALRHNRVGVMIARGDLAIECDFRRMAELQEEILWFCEAAHVPVIWATEVLAQLAKTGMPTRAEITDAAMSERAECAMLNKGPYIVEAMHVLDDILRRMAGHQHKKMARLRPLRLASLTTPPKPVAPPSPPPAAANAAGSPPSAAAAAPPAPALAAPVPTVATPNPLPPSVHPDA